MDIEYEVSILEVNVKELEEKLVELGAIKSGDFLQRRYIYDFNPVLPTKWIRLRTNGIKSTLTIKDLQDKSIVGGMKELEIVVSDFDKTNDILKELGYNHRAYQENKRTIYNLDDVEFDIDTWPMIPTYVEIEGPSEEKVLEIVEKLGYDKKDIVTLGVVGIYREKYNIDCESYKELKFESVE
jgi:adenylate cyclase class 2